MPFYQETLAQQDWQQLLPMARFSPNSTFGRRIVEKREEKQKAAWYTAKKWFSSGRPSAFIIDGSSTFYICLAILTIPGGQPTIITNNLAFSTEIDAHDDADVRNKLKLEILEGEEDFDLNASLGDKAERHAVDVLKRHNLVIASVRELHPQLGPTAPETESRCLKKASMENANLLVIITDWGKLATPPIDNANRVFPCNDDWTKLLQSKEVWVISALPSDINGVQDAEERTEAQKLLEITDTCDFGRKLKASGKDKKPVWLTLHEKYALNVFLLSEKYNVHFVEVR